MSTDRNYFGLGFAANRAGKGFNACGGTGGRLGFNAFVPCVTEGGYYISLFGAVASGASIEGITIFGTGGRYGVTRFFIIVTDSVDFFGIGVGSVILTGIGH